MSAGRNRRRTFSKCGHKGFGAFCHRCVQADGLDAAAQALLGETKREEEMTRLSSEAARLRGRVNAGG